MHIPPRYRSLLVLHPERWRRAHGEVVLQTLLDLHAAQHRSSPSLGERVRFAVSGLQHHLPGAVVVPSHPLVVRDGLARFDQTNGITDVTGDTVPGMDVSERNRRRLQASERAMMAVYMGDR